MKTYSFKAVVESDEDATGNAALGPSGSAFPSSTNSWTIIRTISLTFRNASSGVRTEAAAPKLSSAGQCANHALRSLKAREMIAALNRDGSSLVRRQKGLISVSVTPTVFRTTRQAGLATPRLTTARLPCRWAQRRRALRLDAVFAAPGSSGKWPIDGSDSEPQRKSAAGQYSACRRMCCCCRAGNGY